MGVLVGVAMGVLVGVLVGTIVGLLGTLCDRRCGFKSTQWVGLEIVSDLGIQGLEGSS